MRVDCKIDMLEVFKRVGSLKRFLEPMLDVKQVPAKMVPEHVDIAMTYKAA